MNRVKVITIKREFDTNGHTPFLAECNDFKKYVVKHDRGKELCIINEFLACFFLKHWQLPFASCALIDVSDALIKNTPILSIKNKKLSYYTLPCFGSEFLENAVDVGNFIFDFDHTFFKKLDNSLEVLRTALFDGWVENDDRKPTNYNLLLVEKSQKYKAIPIDHSFIFESLPHSYLDPTLYVAKDNEHLLEAGLGYLIKKQFKSYERLIESERNYFFSSIQTCQKYFFTFAKELQNHYDFSDTDIKKISLFLFDETRNQQVFDEHIYRLTN